MCIGGLPLVYIGLYLANVDTLRTLAWFAGVGVSVALLAMG